jgi:hypothetical protein
MVERNPGRDQTQSFRKHRTKPITVPTPAGLYKKEAQTGGRGLFGFLLGGTMMGEGKTPSDIYS